MSIDDTCHDCKIVKGSVKSNQPSAVTMTSGYPVVDLDVRCFEYKDTLFAKSQLCWKD